MERIDRATLQIVVKSQADKEKSPKTTKPKNGTYPEIDNAFRYYYKQLTSMQPNDKDFARIEIQVKELANQIANRQRIINDTRESLICHSGIAKWQRLLRRIALFFKFW